MLFKKKKNQNTFLGIDFSLNETRIVELEKNTDLEGKPFKIKNFVIIEMPPGAFYEEKVESSIFGELLAEKVKEEKMSGKKTISAVSSSSILTRDETFPISASEREVENVIKNSGKKYTGKDIDDYAFDFYENSENSTSETRSVKIKLCPILSITSREDTLLIADLVPHIIESDESAIFRLYTTFKKHLLLEKGEELYPNDYVLVADINESYLKTYELNENNITSTREIQIRKDIGDNKKDALIQLLDHINQTIFISETNDKKVKAVFLMGDNSIISQLKKLMEEETSYNTLIANPFIDIKIDGIYNEGLNEIIPSLVLACGLAMRGFE